MSVLYVSAQALLKTYACLVLVWSYSEMVITSACHAEVLSSILGNSVKDVNCNFLQKNFGVAGSIPASLTYETVAQLGEHVVW